MIKFNLGTHVHGETGKTYPALTIDERIQELGVFSNIYDNVEDLDYFIEWFKDEIIETNLPDYSFEGNIEWQPILWGSKKSKIAEYVDGKIVGGQEFDTHEFLEVCYAWRDFLKKRIDEESKKEDV